MARVVDSATRTLASGPCAVVLAGAASPVEDAAAERRRATFDSSELARFLHGGDDKLARRCVPAARVGLGTAAAAAACSLPVLQLLLGRTLGPRRGACLDSTLSCPASPQRGAD